PVPAEAPTAPAPPPSILVEQTLERPLRPGEVSLDELERAFRETAIESELAPEPTAAANAAPASVIASAPAPKTKEAKPVVKPSVNKSSAGKAVAEVEVQESDKVANQSIRVNVDTLEHL